MPFLSKVPGNCNLSQIQFHCQSTACVPMAAVCDFTDDCGDGSDEVSCSKSVNKLELIIGSRVLDLTIKHDSCMHEAYVYVLGRYLSYIIWKVVNSHGTKFINASY